MAIKDNLRLIRKLKCLSQKNLEDMTGIHNRLVQMYESGKRIPKDENLQKLANALDVDVWALKDIDINTSDLEAIRQLFFQLDEKDFFNSMPFDISKEDNRGDGKEQFYLTVPIDRDTALFIKQWQMMRNTSLPVEGHEDITYDEWKYDKQKRELANEEMLKQGCLEPYFTEDKTEKE